MLSPLEFSAIDSSRATLGLFSGLGSCMSSFRLFCAAWVTATNEATGSEVGAADDATGNEVAAADDATGSEVAAGDEATGVEVAAAGEVTVAALSFLTSVGSC